jgi:hypothetical protein
MIDLVGSALLVGFFGDWGLQLISLIRGDIVGLKKYFEHHGSLASAFIASGMMGFFTLLYKLSGLPVNHLNLFIYGVILDIIFRFGGIMRSLNDTYYKHITLLNSMIWGGLPFNMALMTFTILKMILN